MVWLGVALLGSALLFFGACRSPRGSAEGKQDATATVREPAADEPISLFITTQLQGTTEPCGCSSEPLGE